MSDAPVAADARYIIQFHSWGAHVAATVRNAGGTVALELPEQAALAAYLSAQAVEGLLRNPNVKLIEVDARRYPLGQTTPYGIPMVQADLVADTSAVNRKICIIDSGYSLGHEDLPTAGVTGVDDSGTGKWSEDGCAHGTHVAGTIAALNNTTGVLGVLPNGNINLHIVKVFGSNCSWTYSSTLVAALNQCTAAGANVVSMSLGGSFSSSTENTAFNNAYNAGVLSVAAAGNAGNTRHSYPASYDSVISVAAIDSAKSLASFSQRNNQVELAAPGVAVRSTVPMGTGKEESLAVDGTGYEVVAMEGSPNLTHTGLLRDCGLGTSACPGGPGQVCLIERGSISFADKVLNCQAGGGVAAVIYNNADALFSGTLGSTSTTIPSVGTAGTTGAVLLGKLGQNSTVSVGVGNYAFYDGTSMATPHVSGVAALVWSHFPLLSNVQIRNTLQATAEDLGAAGRDNSFGYGLVQACAALTSLGGTCGDAPPPPPPPDNQPPTASFTYQCTDLSCSFDGSGSSDTDGSIASYAWTFGDGTTGSGVTVSKTYAAAGTYTVSLTVTDDDGATGSTSQSVTVTAPEPGELEIVNFSSNKKGRSGQFDLMWNTTVAATCVIEVTNGGSTMTANTALGTSHTASFKGTNGVSYTVKITATGSGGTAVFETTYQN